MDLHLATLSDQPSGAGSRAEWNEAYARLQAYLHAYQREDRLHQHDLVGRIVEEAKRRHAADPSQPPVTVTLAVAMEKIDVWFRRTLALDEKLPAARQAAAGRLALLLSGASAQWPEAFLSEHPSPEFVQRMKSASVRAGPDLAVSRMNARSMDYGPLQEARETLDRVAWMPILRAFLVWSAIWIAAYLTYTHHQ